MCVSQDSIPQEKVPAMQEVLSVLLWTDSDVPMPQQNI